MKVLVVRFSSIGDIVLTSPVVRCLKNQIPELQLHYLTKKKFRKILEHNPHIDQLFCIEKSISELLPELKKQQYDYLIDLHHNIRTLQLKQKLGIKSFTFQKLNIRKWFLVRFKINRMPDIHVVDRYFEAVKNLGVYSDVQPCDYFIPQADEISAAERYGIKHFIAFAIGAQFETKRLPVPKIVEIIQQLDLPVILLGDESDRERGEAILTQLPDKTIINCCGTLNLNQSASLVRQAKLLITHDTGLMHIATALGQKIVSVWGNTVPSLGMYPYFPANSGQFTIHEVPDLACRPCSKIGFKSCPKKHFNCMNLQDTKTIAETALKLVIEK